MIKEMIAQSILNHVMKCGNFNSLSIIELQQSVKDGLDITVERVFNVRKNSNIITFNVCLHNHWLWNTLEFSVSVFPTCGKLLIDEVHYAYALNKKKRTIYKVVEEAINCTNEQDGQDMIIYKGSGLTFVRERSEFFKKFDLFYS